MNTNQVKKLVLIVSKEIVLKKIIYPNTYKLESMVLNVTLTLARKYHFLSVTLQEAKMLSLWQLALIKNAMSYISS